MPREDQWPNRTPLIKYPLNNEEETKLSYQEQYDKLFSELERFYELMGSTKYGSGKYTRSGGIIYNWTAKEAEIHEKIEQRIKFLTEYNLDRSANENFTFLRIHPEQSRIQEYKFDTEYKHDIEQRFTEALKKSIEIVESFYKSAGRFWYNWTAKEFTIHDQIVQQIKKLQIVLTKQYEHHEKYLSSFIYQPDPSTRYHRKLYYDEIINDQKFEELKQAITKQGYLFQNEFNYYSSPSENSAKLYVIDMTRKQMKLLENSKKNNYYICQGIVSSAEMRSQIHGYFKFQVNGVFLTESQQNDLNELLIGNYLLGFKQANRIPPENKEFNLHSEDWLNALFHGVDLQITPVLLSKITTPPFVMDNKMLSPIASYCKWATENPPAYGRQLRPLAAIRVLMEKGQVPAPPDKEAIKQFLLVLQDEKKANRAYPSNIAEWQVMAKLLHASADLTVEQARQVRDHLDKGINKIIEACIKQFKPPTEEQEPNRFVRAQKQLEAIEFVESLTNPNNPLSFIIMKNRRSFLDNSTQATYEFSSDRSVKVSDAFAKIASELDVSLNESRLFHKEMLLGSLRTVELARVN